ncbi:MAG: hypothetical protein ACXAEN_25945 [Candidatus Thorarchaeota archaeon]|jgi:hypothetical protein
MAKYLFASEMDKEILYTYSINTDSKPRLINLAKKFNMPRWALYQRALKIGAVKSSHQKIRKRLEKAGFKRSIASIVLKRKRMRLLSNLEGMSACLCAQFLGIQLQLLLKHIKSGLLKAEAIRYDRQGKVNYYIREKSLRKFIIHNPDLIDLRKVEKYYFIELLANGKVH